MSALLPEGLRSAHLPGVPEAVTNAVFNYAWQEGHSSGEHEVEQIYVELADIVKLMQAPAMTEVFDRLFAYSEWLDGQTLIVGDDASGDTRSHEDLVNDFLKGA